MVVSVYNSHTHTHTGSVVESELWDVLSENLLLQLQQTTLVGFFCLFVSFFSFFFVNLSINRM